MTEAKIEKRGGPRPNSGRKPTTVKGVLKKLGKERKDVAALVLIEIDAVRKWKNLIESEDERIQLDTLKYLTDRAYGKPKQSMEVSTPDGSDGEIYSNLTDAQLIERRETLLRIVLGPSVKATVTPDE
jgi:hypothetical protein